MELLNHLVAAKLMKTAQVFERIGAHGAARQLPAPGPVATARPMLGLVVDNCATMAPSPAHLCPGDERCSENTQTA
ncbi:hypothetical protein ACQR16_27535 [Bradyrhizobium oligotrophicum]|uniref:hypothetical protein n=1 Tax=Bradyrhizobium oligotrophicum TaxID=44255 RepID=UPI003EBD3739